RGGGAAGRPGARSAPAPSPARRPPRRSAARENSTRSAPAGRVGTARAAPTRPSGPSALGELGRIGRDDRLGRRLHDPDVVAERVAPPHGGARQALGLPRGARGPPR